MKKDCIKDIIDFSAMAKVTMPGVQYPFIDLMVNQRCKKPKKP